MSDLESHDLVERDDFEMQELPEYSRYASSETVCQLQAMTRI